jgi:MFS family permease
MAGTSSALRALAAVGRNRRLLAVQAAYVTFNLAEWATWIAILVYAYEVGGAAATGVVVVVQLAPAMIIAPLAGSLGDRHRRERLLQLAYLCQALAAGLTGLSLLLEWPVALIYALAAATASSVTLTRPIQGALLPSLAASPEELTAANVVAGTIQSLSMIAGPAITAVLLRVGEPGTVFVVMAGLLVGGFLLVAVNVAPGRRVDRGAQAGPGELVSDTLEAFRLVVRNPKYVTVVAILAAPSFQEGALDVLLVVLAVVVLDIGESGVGWLNACLGGGALIGSLASIALVGRSRLALPILIASLVLGGSLILVGVAPGPQVAAALLLAVGAATSMMDVAGRTLTQRVVADAALSRIFGLMEGMRMGGLAIGAVLVSTLVEGIGHALTFAIAGALLPVVCLCLWRPLRRIDDSVIVPVHELNLVRSIPLFSGLAVPIVERIAANLIPVRAAAGTEILKEGDSGDRLYIVDDGEVEVSIGGRPVRRQGQGEFFGEISLLLAVPRTATVKAVSDVALFALERWLFLEVLTGHAQVREGAEAVADERLGLKRD